MYLVIDTETTGLPDWRLPADAEGQPRLASWCFILADRDCNPVHEWHGLVRPDRWTMPPDAGAINGLTNERLQAEGFPIAWPLSLFAMALQANWTLVAHNLAFDMKIMRGELRRGGYRKEADRSDGIGLCTMRELTARCALPNPKKPEAFKFPRLAEACEIILKEKLEGAHDAVNDARACLRLLRSICGSPRREEELR